jgi:hypothetical protein
LPQLAFLFEQRAQGLALRGQLEGLPFRREDASDGGVPEKRDDAGVRDREDTGILVAGDKENAEH